MAERHVFATGKENMRCGPPEEARSPVRCLDRRPLRRARPRAPADDALPAAARRQPLLMAITTEKRKCNRDVPRSTEGLYVFPLLRTLR